MSDSRAVYWNGLISEPVEAVSLPKESYGQMVGGRDRDRTGDPLLAKQVLSQLSYTPTSTTTSF